MVPGHNIAAAWERTLNGHITCVASATLHNFSGQMTLVYGYALPQKVKVGSGAGTACCVDWQGDTSGFRKCLLQLRVTTSSALLGLLSHTGNMGRTGILSVTRLTRWASTLGRCSANPHRNRQTSPSSLSFTSRRHQSRNSQRRWKYGLSTTVPSRLCHQCIQESGDIVPGRTNTPSQLTILRSASQTRH